MCFFSRQARPQELSKDKAAAIEQRTLTISLYAVGILVVGSLGYGLFIGSDVVIANGIFSFFSLFGSGLNLAAAKLVARPADKKFQYGYWHLEPLVLFVNGLLLCCICFYAIINSIETIRTGGRVVDAEGVILFGVVSGLLCGVVWFSEVTVARRINSDLVRNDSREWFMDFFSSMITLVGFLVLNWLEEPWYSLWARYADSVLIIIMAVMLVPLPIRLVVGNVREILLITKGDDPISRRVGKELARLRDEYPGIVSDSSHVVKVGRSYFVEVNILVTPEFPLQSVAKQDRLRERLWRVCDKGASELWLAVCVTEEERWT